MGRRKTAGRCNIRPWLSAKADCKEGRFIQIGNSLLLSEQFGKLKAGARDLYFRMAMESGGEREFTFPASSAERHHIPASSFERFKAELIDAGFIRIKESGRLTREKNVYEFVFDWKARPPSKTMHKNFYAFWLPHFGGWKSRNIPHSEGSGIGTRNPLPPRWGNQ